MLSTANEETPLFLSSVVTNGTNLTKNFNHDKAAGLAELGHPQPTVGNINNCAKSEDALYLLYKNIVSLRRQHRLAYEHLKSLETTRASNPLIFITLASGIMSFISSADSTLISLEFKDLMSLLVGVMSFFSIAWQQLVKQWNYGPRAEMHKIVNLAMKKVLAKMTFDYIRIVQLDSSTQQGSTEEGQDAQEDQNEKGRNGKSVTEEDGDDSTPPRPLSEREKHLMEGIQTYSEIVEQSLDSCSSIIPLKITEAFLLLESKIELGFQSEETIRIVLEKFPGTPLKRSMRMIHEHACDELSAQFSGARGWPRRLADPTVAVDTAMKKMNEAFRDCEIFLS